MLEWWRQQVTGAIHAWFGPEGLSQAQAHPVFYGWLALLATFALVVLLTVVGLRVASRLGEALLLRLDLLRTESGRRALLAAGELRRGSRRLRAALARERGETSEAATVAVALGRFAREDLPSVLRRLRSTPATDAVRLIPALRRQLDEQTRRWSEGADGPERERLQAAIAASRHRLAQLERTERERMRLSAALVEAARTLRMVETELASLELARVPALPHLRQQLDARAQGLRFEREAHMELHGSR
jgi:hypothetical protein